ncbi:MAG: TonB-dependent receptor [Wolinella succinogenes]|uniref:TonB-dependent siderophore receptor n=1 Tax=Wolinella succinogenes TaxID=844 RepID=UPI0016923567|nr:TonB-dependent receptor [Wolinella succinogenes]NLU33364.1 TonB-dependent receptor [Wolinella succinogenes]
MNKMILALSSLTLLCGGSLLAQEVYTTQKGTLKEALESISKQSHLSYAGDSILLESQKVNGVKGVEGIEKALEMILEGTGLEAIIQNETIVIRQKGNQPALLKTISVQAEGEEGGAKEGYLVKETTNIGPWRGKSLQDTPYAINVMSEELLKNLQATTIDQLYAANPTIVLAEPQSAWGASVPVMRGFSTYATTYNGIKREKLQYAVASNPEEYERVETITGLSGFLYGAGNIGGVINYIPKRPTATAQKSITVGNAGGSGYYAHADLGGPIDEKGKFGYRLNLLTQDTDTYAKDQNSERTLASLALDWHVTDSLLIQLLASHSEDTLTGKQANWSLDSGASRPSASSIDTTKLWGQKWGVNENETTKYSANVEWNLAENINFRTAVLKETTKAYRIESTNTIQADGTYSQITTDWGEDYSKIYGYGGYAFLDFDFDTFGIKHELTTGVQVSDSYWDMYRVASPYAVTLSGLTLDSPTHVAKPVSDRTSQGSFKDVFHTRSTNYTIGDSIEFGPQWSMLAGVSHVTVENKSSIFNDGYKESAVTPSVSLVYKPIENLSLYTSYMEGFEQGGIAGASYGGFAVVNANEVMNPLKSEQIEIGAKWTLGDLLLTAALFQIDKGLEYYDLTDITKPRYVQDGRQVHKGLETTFVGRLTPELTLLGGFTYLDAQVKENKESPELEGKRPTEVSDKFAKLYVEYAPFDDLNLALIAGVNHTSSFYGDSMNTDKMPGYTLLNAGVRYVTKVDAYPLTFRLNVNNVTDKAYWINSAYLGDRRTIHASMSLKF